MGPRFWVAALALLPSIALAQTPPSPAKVGITSTTLPEVVQILDKTSTWVTIGTIDPATHTFTVTGGGYTLPVASTTVLGGVKVDGTTITATGGGVISAASSGGGTITANSTPTSGFTAGQMLYSDGTKAQAANLINASPLVSQRNSTTAQALRVYNTYTDASNGEWGTLDWQTSPGNLIIGSQKNGTGGNRSVIFSVGGTNFMDLGATNGSYVAVHAGLLMQDNPFINTGGSVLRVYGFGADPNWGTPTITPSGTCTVGTKVGGGFAGTFVLTAACTAGNTLVFTGMGTAPAGYACDAQDRTKPTALFTETASTTTGFTLTAGAVVNGVNDVIQFKCIGY